VSRLRRFLHLERPRAEASGSPGAEPSPATAGRFGGVERPGTGPEPGAPRSSGADLDRFGPEPPPSIELLETAAGERPFTRCMRCGMDHNVFASECAGCGASLDTAEQRDFNDRLWAKRQGETAREAAAAAERREREAREQAELAAARRAMGEELAREVGKRERIRLGMDERGWTGWGSGAQGYTGAPVGLRILRALPDWRWQLGAIVAALALVGGLVAYGLRGHPGAVFVAIVVAILLVAPQWRMRGW
jgi:hypothetical protein